MKELTPEQIFAQIFGQTVEQANPAEVIAQLTNQYDVIKRITARALVAESHHRGWERYFGRRRFYQYFEDRDNAQESLRKALSAAQPFVQEDLGFIDLLARDESHCATTDALIDRWPTVAEGSGGITRQQKEILRGNVAFKK